MSFEVRYYEIVFKEDLPKISKDWRDIIKQTIEEKLTKQPEIFGKPLRSSFRGFRTLRVGDYRIVFHIEKSIVKIALIEHRSVVYQTAAKRFKGFF